jgi:GTPase SAR1 family protein
VFAFILLRARQPPTHTSPPPGSGAVVYAFSTTDRESFLAVENWKRKVDEECGDIPCVLVQNKIDMLAQAQVDPYVGRAMHEIAWLSNRGCTHGCSEHALMSGQSVQRGLNGTSIIRCIACLLVLFIRAEVEDLARKLGIKLYRTCVKDNVLIEEGV